MGRAPCCDKENVKKGPWSPEEDDKLKEYIDKNGTGGNWISLPQRAGLKRCGKSCRLRWLNYLRPNIKHGDFSDDEDRIICSLFASIGSRWSIIAAQLPGRTDNDIKNYWNTKLKKKLMGIMTPNSSHKRTQLLDTSSLTSSAYNTCSTIDQTNYYMTNMYSNIPQVVLQAQDHQGYMSNFMHMFGGDQASSSSSDGSSNNLQSYLNNGFQPNNVDQNPLIDCSSLEEIKQLISTNNLSNNFFVDHEIKTEEDKVTFY